MDFERQCFDLALRQAPACRGCFWRPDSHCRVLGCWCWENKLGQERLRSHIAFLSDELVMKTFPFMPCFVLLKVCWHIAPLICYCHELAWRGWKQRGLVCGGFKGGTVVKNPRASAGEGREASLIPGLGRSPGEEWPPTSVFLPGNFHEQRSLLS